MTMSEARLPSHASPDQEVLHALRHTPSPHAEVRNSLNHTLEIVGPIAAGIFAIDEVIKGIDGHLMTRASEILSTYSEASRMQHSLPIEGALFEPVQDLPLTDADVMGIYYADLAERKLDQAVVKTVDDLITRAEQGNDTRLLDVLKIVALSSLNNIVLGDEVHDMAVSMIHHSSHIQHAHSIISSGLEELNRLTGGVAEKVEKGVERALGGIPLAGTGIHHIREIGQALEESVPNTERYLTNLTEDYLGKGTEENISITQGRLEVIVALLMPELTSASAKMVAEAIALRMLAHNAHNVYSSSDPEFTRMRKFITLAATLDASQDGSLSDLVTAGILTPEQTS